jgi:iron-regulated transporter 1
MGASLEVERNMPKIISSLSNDGHGDGTATSSANSDTLAIMNARMKAIDLTCLIASPILVGVIMSYSGSVVWACFLLLLWNMMAWFPECWLIKLAIDSCPALAAPKSKPSKETYKQEQPATATNSSSIDDFLYSLNTYFLHQPSLPTSVALSLLYLTVMSFGPLMTAYLAWRGMEEGVLSLWRGAGAASGISATLIFPYLQQKLGLLRTAMLALWFQFLCLLFGVASSSSPSSAATSSSNNNKSTLLVVGLVLSRFGLWTFDLAANQLIQETVHVDKLGRVNGVQSSLQSFCQMFAYVAGVVVWQPEKFPQLMWASCGCVFLAGCLSTFAYLHHRGM